MSGVIGYTAKIEVAPSTISGIPQYTEIPNCTMISTPAVEWGEVETTTLQSPTTTRTHIPTLQDPGKITFECQYSDTTWILLASVDGVVLPWRVSSPEAEDQTFTFDGHLSKYGADFEIDTLAKVKCETRVDGPITVGTIP